MHRIGSLSFATPFEFDMALLGPVTSMMENGLNVDLDKKNEFSAVYTSKWHHEQEQLNSVIGYELNVGSPKAVAECLYGDLGLPERRYQGKVTTNEASLRSLLALCESKVRKSSPASRMKWLRGYLSLMKIITIRSLRKRLSSYINARVDRDGHMRCTISVGGTETARFSHSMTLWGTGCNLATIPHELRSMFIADKDKELAELDLNRGESWIYSHLASDPTMMAIHREGGDFHIETACAISVAFGEKPIRRAEWADFAAENPTKAYRLRFLGKKNNHASAYRMGPIKGAEEVNKEADDTGITCTAGQFKEAQRLWIRKYSRMPEWWRELEGELSESRTLKTPFGRVRTFYGHWGDELFKEATAYKPQSASVDYLNLGMLHVYRSLVTRQIGKKWGLELLHQNHDSILIQYYPEYRDRILSLAVEHMTHTIKVNDYDITIPIEVEVGQSWGELKPWEEAVASPPR